MSESAGESTDRDDQPLAQELGQQQETAEQNLDGLSDAERFIIQAMRNAVSDHTGPCMHPYSWEIYLSPPPVNESVQFDSWN